MTRPAWLPYVVPMALFLLLTTLESSLPRTLYPYAYLGKVGIVLGGLLVCFRYWKPELRSESKAIGWGIVAGALGLGLWLGLDALQPAAWALGKRTAYNPFQELTNPTLRLVFLTGRFFGLAVLVPILEEVFWRSFLLRFVTDQENWQERLVPGQFSLPACGIVTGLFALAHPEWLAALGYALLIAGLLRHTRSLLSCIIAHGVTNAALGVYVLLTGKWQYW